MNTPEQLADMIEQFDALDEPLPLEQMSVVATELRRLASIEAKANSYIIDNARLAAENAALKAALQEIADDATDPYADGWCGAIAEQALAAMKETP